MILLVKIDNKTKNRVYGIVLPTQQLPTCVYLNDTEGKPDKRKN